MERARSVWWLTLVLALALAACGRDELSEGPEAVHAGWVHALRDNDRAALLALAADSEFREMTVDQSLATMQDYVRNGYGATGIDGGAFQGVDLLPLQDRGRGKVGYSRWRFANLAICYSGELTATPDGWRVAQWGQELESACEVVDGG
jgi:hypothetical protein